jgi:segregation and condensation protein A
MRETLAAAASVVVVDQTPLHVYMDQIVQQLEGTPRLPFSAVFSPPHTRGRLVGLFLAVLELTRARRVLPEQPDPFGDIWLTRGPGPESGRVGE